MPDTINKEKSKNEGSKQKQSEKKQKSALAGILTLFAVLVVIAAVFGGAFYFIIHGNVGGLAEKNRKSIQNIPVLRLALPAAPDPTSPEYMTAKEIIKKYVEYKNLSSDLKKQLDAANKQISELQKFKDEYDKEQKSIEDTKKSQDAKQKQLEDLKKTVDQLIANGDKAGLAQYFPTVDPATAKAVYAEVIKQQQVNANTKKFAQIYEAMDASAAAQIFESMGNSQIDLITRTLKSMKKESAAAILAAMTSDFASKVTKKLDASFQGN